MVLTAAIIRILGNENPPRDVPGQREQALRRILVEEASFPGVTKWYLLNRIFDRAYHRQLCEVLDQHDAHYISVPFPRQEFADLEDVKIHGVGLNQARNLAIRLGSKLARYVAVLDGDCFFAEAGWAPIAAEMALDRYRYLSVPFRRMGAKDCGEPQLIFRNDSDLRFDEARPFGKADKLELLYRLGHDRTTNGGHLQIEGDLTKLVGEVLHFPTGTPAAEHQLHHRMTTRNQSMELFAQRIATWPWCLPNLNRPHLGRHVREELYASLAHDAPDRCRVVTDDADAAARLGLWFRGLGQRAQVETSAALPELSNLDGLVHPLAASYADNSLDIVVLADGTDSAAIQTWYPKVRPGGIMVGQNFKLDRTEVLANFTGKPLEYVPHLHVWKNVKYGIERPTERIRRWY